jgi:hypothetical protein
MTLFTGATETDEADAGDAIVTAEIIEFPGRQIARERLLASAVIAALTGLECRLGLQLVECGPLRSLRIDAYAVIDIPTGSKDFRFRLQVNSGGHILLVTDDVAMIADFARQYVLARIKNHAVLQELLQ